MLYSTRECSVSGLTRPSICRIVLILSLEIEDSSLEAILSSLIKPPSVEESNFALAYLQSHSLVDEDMHLTALGSLVALLPLDPVARKMCVDGLLFRCFSMSSAKKPRVLWLSPAYATIRLCRHDERDTCVRQHTICSNWFQGKKGSTLSEPLVCQLSICHSTALRQRA